MNGYFKDYIFQQVLLAGYLLVGGKYFLNILPFSSSIGEYPLVVIIVLFASLLLGQKSKVSDKTNDENDVGDTFLSKLRNLMLYNMECLF